MRIELTDDEQQQLLDAIWTKRDDGPNGYPVVRWGIEFPVVESIVAARIAEAFRDAAKRIYNGAGDPEQAFYNYGLNPWLIEIANEYEPKESA